MVRIPDRVSDGAGITVDLVIVASLGCFITKEVNVLVGDATGVLGVALQMAQAVRLIPASWENVKGDLPTNGESVHGEVSMHTVASLAGFESTSVQQSNKKTRGDLRKLAAYIRERVLTSGRGGQISP